MTKKIYLRKGWQYTPNVRPGEFLKVYVTKEDIELIYVEEKWQRALITGFTVKFEENFIINNKEFFRIETIDESPLKIEKTARGYSIVNFKDCHDAPCKLQISSLASNDTIWFGLVEGEQMLLNRQQIMDILPFLKNFSQKGTFE